jgi:heme-degrading monooxygenase HmoA
MVIEYIRYAIPAEQHEQFEAAWTEARTVLDEAPECLAYEVAHGVEEPDSYVVRIEWTSLEDHEQGFRRSAGFAAFFAAVKPFFERIAEMRHYQLTTIGGRQRTAGI